jgi:phosphoesterase RecJ-like protein
MAYFDQQAEAVFSVIEKYDSIVIFGHKNPDGDCVGSVKGLRAALRAQFPEKKIYGVGTIPGYLPTSFIEPADEVSDEVIQNSLAVMVDLSDLDRVEDQRIRTAKEIVCVDHHIADHEVEFPIVRDVSAPSATFILTKLLLNRYGKITDDAARYLYLGLCTDSGRFQFDSRPEVFRVASLLTEHDFSTRDLYNELYQQRGKDLRFRSFIYSNFVETEKVVYCVVSKKDYEALGMTEQEAGGKVNLLALLDHHPMWCTFTELSDGTVRTELRSDGTYNVQQAAVNFGGGGHVPAAGCTLKQLSDFQQVVDFLNAMEPIKK